MVAQEPEPRPAGYVRDIRELTGSRLLLLPAVSVHIRDDRGRLLLVHQRDRGQWGTVGGAVEPGESPADAAVREAKEETGLDVVLTGLVDALGGPDFEMTYPNGDECAYLSIVYDAQAAGGALVPDGIEVSRCEWFLPDELASLDLGSVSRAVLSAVGLIPPADAGVRTK